MGHSHVRSGQLPLKNLLVLFSWIKMSFLGDFLNVNIMFIFTDVRVQEVDNIHMLLNQWKVYAINILLSFIANRLMLVPQ